MSMMSRGNAVNLTLAAAIVILWGVILGGWMTRSKSGAVSAPASAVVPASLEPQAAPPAPAAEPAPPAEVQIPSGPLNG